MQASFSQGNIAPAKSRLSNSRAADSRLGEPPAPDHPARPRALVHAFVEFMKLHSMISTSHEQQSVSEAIYAELKAAGGEQMRYLNVLQTERVVREAVVGFLLKLSAEHAEMISKCMVRSFLYQSSPESKDGRAA